MTGSLASPANDDPVEVLPLAGYTVAVTAARRREAEALLSMT